MHMFIMILVNKRESGRGERRGEERKGGEGRGEKSVFPHLNGLLQYLNIKILN